MQRLDLEPTIKNIFSTFIENKIDRNEDVFSFIELLSEINENYSIALDGQWGSGKTFFVKQIIMILDALDGRYSLDYEDKYKTIIDKLPQELRENELKHFPVYFDAWANDNDDDPLLSILYCIAKNYDIKLPSEENWKKLFVEIADIALDNPITTSVTLGANKIIKTSIRRAGTIKKTFEGENLFERIEKSKNIEERINKFFDNLVINEENVRIVIFIDELDRCKPNYAVQLLERIKHYMIHEKITFVFSTNLTELSHTIQQCYGNDFGGYKYLEKFFVEIHELQELTAEQLIKLYGFSSREYKDFVLHYFIREYDVPLRSSLKMSQKIKKHFSKIVAYPYDEGLSNFFFLKDNIFIPYLICLKIYNDDNYRKFISGETADFDMILQEVVRIPFLSKIISGSSESPDERLVLENFKKTYIQIFRNRKINQPYSEESLSIASITIPKNARDQILNQIQKIK